MPTAVAHARQAVLLSAVVLAALLAGVAGCGRDAQTVATGPTPAVASSPTADGADGLPPVRSATATAEPVTASPVGPRATPTPTSPAPAPTPTSGVLRLTNADAGRTITVARGDVILLELSGSYLPPTADDAGILRTEEHAGGYPGPDPATGRFTAIGRGVARITSTTDAACLHSVPRCMIAQQQFTVTIRVR
jgi:hypothetical protein